MANSYDTQPIKRSDVYIEGTASDSENVVDEVMVGTETTGYQLATLATYGDWSTWPHGISSLLKGFAGWRLGQQRTRATHDGSKLV